MVAVAILKNKKSPYLSNDLTDRSEIWQNVSFWLFNPSRPFHKKFTF